jgi:DNA repair protein RadC
MRLGSEPSASSIMLVHNHLSSNTSPSAVDGDMTTQFIEAGRTLRISVHNHLVVS